MGNTELRQLDGCIKIKSFATKGFKEIISNESFVSFQSHARNACEFSINLMAFPILEELVACFYTITHKNILYLSKKI